MKIKFWIIKILGVYEHLCGLRLIVSPRKRGKLSGVVLARYQIHHS